MKQHSSLGDHDWEAACLSSLAGPGVVPLLGAGGGGEHGGAELQLAAAACSLADVLAERGPLPDAQVRAVAAAAAAALARVHASGLVHGDVKPANLLLSYDGKLWLADFDAAAQADGRPLARGSPARLAPGTPARPESDMAALAIALVELSTGTLVDPGIAWRASDLRRLGCSPALSAEISLLFGGPDSGPTALAAVDMFERHGPGALPAPATGVRRVDPTPTVEFMPMRPLAPSAPGASQAAAAGSAAPWWQRLAKSWRPST